MFLLPRFKGFSEDCLFLSDGHFLYQEFSTFVIASAASRRIPHDDVIAQGVSEFSRDSVCCTFWNGAIHFSAELKVEKMDGLRHSREEKGFHP